MLCRNINNLYKQYLVKMLHRSGDTQHSIVPSLTERWNFYRSVEIPSDDFFKKLSKYVYNIGLYCLLNMALYHIIFHVPSG